MELTLGHSIVNLGFFGGNLHPALIHFPIVLFVVGFACDLLCRLGYKGSYPTGHWMIIGAAVTSIPTAIVGLIAAQSHGEHSFNVEIHRNLAYLCIGYGFFHALFRTYIIRTHPLVSSRFLISLSLTNVLLIGAVAEYGGVLVRGSGLFLEVRQTPESKEHSHQHNHSDH